MKANQRPAIAIALTAILALSGCIGNAQDQLGLASDDGDANLEVSLTATNASDDVAHIGAVLDGVFVHEADAPEGEDYFELELESARADVVGGGDVSAVTAATGDVPAGSYDQVLLRTEKVLAHGADAMGGGGGHGDHSDHGGEDGHHADSNESDDGHDHAHGDEGQNDTAKSDRASLSVTTAAVDLPVNATFDVADDATTSVEIAVDVGASTAGEGFSPVFEVTVKQDGETVETTTASIDAAFTGGETTVEPETPPPAARMTVFGPSGDQLHDPGFEVENGVFVNSLTSAAPVGGSFQFAATKTEAVAEGATIESFEWDFGDGASATGQTVDHAYSEPGAYEVTLTATDSNGVSNTHTLRVIVASWTQSAVDTHFEDGPGNWTASTTGTTTTWALDGEPYEAGSAWHAANHPHSPGYTYENFATATLTSPNITIPEDWVQAGFSVQVHGGGAEEGLYSNSDFTVAYTDGEEPVQVDQFTEVGNWTELGSQAALSDLTGETVQFQFTFSTSGNAPVGDGWFVDAFQIGGIAEEDFRNADLLEEGGDGHDHEH